MNSEDPRLVAGAQQDRGRAGATARRAKRSTVGE